MHIDSSSRMINHIVWCGGEVPMSICFGSNASMFILFSPAGLRHGRRCFGTSFSGAQWRCATRKANAIQNIVILHDVVGRLRQRERQCKPEGLSRHGLSCLASRPPWIRLVRRGFDLQSRLRNHTARLCGQPVGHHWRAWPAAWRNRSSRRFLGRRETCVVNVERCHPSSHLLRQTRLWS